jgi:hypothetical protein
VPIPLSSYNPFARRETAAAWQPHARRRSLTTAFPGSAVLLAEVHALLHTQRCKPFLISYDPSGPPSMNRSRRHTPQQVSR